MCLCPVTYNNESDLRPLYTGTGRTNTHLSPLFTELRQKDSKSQFALHPYLRVIEIPICVQMLLSIVRRMLVLSCR
jgi:hypothetical protein